MIDGSTISKYLDEASFILLEGAPLSEFDCRCKLMGHSLTLMYRASKLDCKDAYVVSGFRSRKALFDVYVFDDSTNDLIVYGAIYERDGSFFTSCDYTREQEFGLWAMNLTVLECLMQNAFVVTNWLLMMKKVKHNEDLIVAHDEVVLDPEAKPSSREDAPIQVLSKPSGNDESTVKGSPENIIYINEDGDALITGRKFLRLTTFWLVCQHERKVNGKTVVVKAHLRGPNRDCDAAKAALERYLASGHDKIYRVN